MESNQKRPKMTEEEASSDRMEIIEPVARMPSIQPVTNAETQDEGLEAAQMDEVFERRLNEAIKIEKEKVKKMEQTMAAMQLEHNRTVAKLQATIDETEKELWWNKWINELSSYPMDPGDVKAALQQGCEQGDMRKVKYAVDCLGADVDAVANSGSIPVNCAIRDGHVDVCKYLIERYDADVNARESNGNTALHSGALHGDLQLFKYLVEDQNGDVNARNDWGSTVLHEATQYGNLEVCKYLVEHHNADVNANNDYGRTVLHEASRNGNLEVCKYLVEVCGVGSIAEDTRDGLTPLRTTVHNGYGWNSSIRTAEEKENIALLLIRRGKEVAS